MTARGCIEAWGGASESVHKKRIPAEKTDLAQMEEEDYRGGNSGAEKETSINEGPACKG